MVLTLFKYSAFFWFSKYECPTILVPYSTVFNQTKKKSFLLSVLFWCRLVDGFVWIPTWEITAPDKPQKNKRTKLGKFYSKSVNCSKNIATWQRRKISEKHSVLCYCDALNISIHLRNNKSFIIHRRIDRKKSRSRHPWICVHSTLFTSPRLTEPC